LTPWPSDTMNEEGFHTPKPILIWLGMCSCPAFHPPSHLHHHTSTPSTPPHTKRTGSAQPSVCARGLGAPALGLVCIAASRAPCVPGSLCFGLPCQTEQLEEEHRLTPPRPYPPSFPPASIHTNRIAVVPECLPVCPVLASMARAWHSLWWRLPASSRQHSCDPIPRSRHPPPPPTHTH